MILVPLGNTLYWQLGKERINNYEYLGNSVINRWFSLLVVVAILAAIAVLEYLSIIYSIGMAGKLC